MAAWRASIPLERRSRRPINCYVRVVDGNVELALKRLKRAVGDCDLTGELKRREFPMSRGQKRTRGDARLSGG